MLKNLKLNSEQSLTLILCLTLYLTLFSYDSFGFPKIASAVICFCGFILAFASAYSILAFAGFLALTVYSIWLVDSQLGFHPDVSTYSPLLHTAFFLFLWRAFLHKLFIAKDSKLIYIISVSFITATYYFFPALSKIKMSPHFYEWAIHNDVQNMSAAMCFYGWSTACNLLTSAPLWKILNSSTFLVLFVQLVSVFVLWGRPLIIFSLFKICFHALIFLITGDLFFGLILLNIYLLFVGYQSRKESIVNLLTTKNIAFVVVLVSVTLLLRFQQELGWFDMRISQKYMISLVDRQGKEHKIDPQFWNQYMSYFVYSDFSFLLEKTAHPVLTVGTSDTSNFSAYIVQQNLKDVEEFKKARPELKTLLNVEIWKNGKALTFVEKFIFEKCVKKNGTTGSPLWLRHYYHSYPTDQYITKCDNLDVVAFKIFMEEGFFNGTTVDITDRVQVFEHSYY